MSVKRGHFSAAVIRKLKDRVNQRCSRPTCRAQTSAPASGGKVNTVGTAAHICAASPQGARYNKKQSASERNGIDNAIWLCNICAREIDLDEDRFPVSLLREWKVIAEDLAMRELGNRIRPKDEMHNVLAAAFTGKSTNVLYDAINNIHNATAEAWEHKDPRFKVVTEFVNGVQTLGLYAKEDVPFKMAIMPEYVDEFVEKQRRFIECGKGFEIKSSGVIISGLPLFEEMTNGLNGRLSISQHAIDARQKVILRDAANSSMDAIDDFLGSVTSGITAFSFNGSTFEGLLSMDYSHPISGDGIAAKVSINLSLESWIGKDLLRLPYFSKMHSLFKKLHDGWEMQTSLDIHGETAIKSHFKKFNEIDFIEQTYIFLSYIEMCRKIAKATGATIPYQDSIGFDHQHYVDVANIVSRLEGKHVISKSALLSNPRSVIVFPVENRPLLSGNSSRSIKIVSESVETINLFEVSVTLPALIHGFENVTFSKIKTLEVNDLKESWEIEFIPGDNFQYMQTYEL